jgi:hypothetical protein
VNADVNANSNNNDDSVAVGVRSHSRPARATRSAREEGRTDPTAKPAKREPPKERGPREADPSAEMRNKLRETVKDDITEDDDEMPSHDASGTEDDASGEGEPVKGEEEGVEAQGEEAQVVDDAPLKQAQEQVKAYEKHITEVRESAGKVLRENLVMQKRLEFYESALKEALTAAKLEVDPRALKLMEIEAEKAADGELGNIKTTSETAEQTARHKAEVDTNVKRITGEVTKAAKASNLDAKQLARRYAMAVKDWMDGGEQGEEPTVADAVDEMKAISATRQAKTSAKAPTLARGKPATTAAVKRPPNDHAGWAQLLKARGFADA